MFQASKIAAEFWSKVDVRDSKKCWNWKAGMFTQGYGAAMLLGRPHYASRIAFMLAHGDPGKRLVLHSCDNRKCCNPSHLRLGTHRDNMKDMADQGRASQGDEHWTRQRPKDVLKGAKVGNSKLTAVEVRSIRKAREQGDELHVIAERFGITKQRVWQIVHRKAWAHLN